ncbi:hypothetical protein ARMGADRAFT_582089 [Armillaria gallica]|uniref:Secreted protein n=1 Tax=Armillaria gallica TaxID=47427 RepID=A0A2H3EB34_ARMGA|nr:hypothetical protein ARMGADRAFT_582089 [Armillaria gallica]
MKLMLLWLIFIYQDANKSHKCEGSSKIYHRDPTKSSFLKKYKNCAYMYVLKLRKKPRKIKRPRSTLYRRKSQRRCGSVGTSKRGTTAESLGWIDIPQT